MNTDNQSNQIFCNDPKHKELAQQIYQRGLELLKQKKHIESLLYNISEAVIAINENYQINIINKIASELLGVEPKEAENKNIKDLLILTDEQNNQIDPSTYCFKPNDTTLKNLIFNSKNGQKFLKLTSTTIINPSEEKECVITLTDITQEKLLEKTKDEFISIASHELRTPITIIKSYLWMLENSKYGDLNEKQKEFLNKAKGGVERMLAMINDTLNTSKIDQGVLKLKIEMIEIRTFLDSLTQDFSIKAQEKGLSFILEITEDCEFVFADRTKLQEMLINLVGNSIKFTQQGWIKLTVTKQNDGFVKFEVIDTGRGIEPQNIDKLFQKFGRIDNSYQTVAEAGGTGLGLYIVKNLAQSMGGQVGAFSEGINKGASFFFTLPCDYSKIPKNLQEESLLKLSTYVSGQITTICPLVD